MVSIITHEDITRFSSWDEIEAKVISGEIKVGNQIGVEMDGELATFDVIGIGEENPVEKDDKTLCYVTIQLHDLLEERPFDIKGAWGSNEWETSEIREYLNSFEFMNRFADLPEHLAKVWKKNNSGEDTADMFFLLSVDEYDPDKTPYSFYHNQRNRVKFGPDDRTDWHWTRSANRGNATYTWLVSSTGTVTYAINAYRFSPACVLAIH